MNSCVSCGLQVSEEDSSRLDEATVVCRGCMAKNHTELAVLDELRDQNPLTLKEFKFDEVLPGVFLANENAARSWDILRDHGIKRVLNVAKGAKMPFGDQGIEYLYVPLDDNLSQRLHDALRPCLEFIQSSVDAELPLVVHCVSGLSRSASIIVAFLMHSRKLSCDEAMAFLSHKTRILINSNFQEQLNQLQDRTK